MNTVLEPVALALNANTVGTTGLYAVAIVAILVPFVIWAEAPNPMFSMHVVALVRQEPVFCVTQLSADDTTADCSWDTDYKLFAI